MKDGMLSVAWASDPPTASVSTQAKSFDSRTTVENEVRTKAAAASSTIEISRVHSTSRVMALSDVMVGFPRDYPAWSGLLRACRSGMHHGGTEDTEWRRHVALSRHVLDDC